MSETLIAPSVLAADFGALRSEMQDVESAGADLLHIDVMDGSFVPPITFGDNMVAVAKGAVNIPIEAHLMIKQPARHLDAYARAGADRIIIHYETCPHLHKDLADIKKLGCSNGVALNPATPINVVEDILEDCDLVLIMTVNPGWGGQKFIDMTLCKIEQLKARITQRGLPTLVEVDGGIDPTTAPKCVAAGVDILVAGTAVFGREDRKHAINALRTAS